jgi:hypothetical protein
MQKIIYLFIFGALLTMPAWARLGETEDQCVSRYGAAIKTIQAGEKGPYKSLIFLKNEYYLAVEFIDGKAGLIYFTKAGRPDLSDNEIQVLLDANSGGQKWTKSDQVSINPLWTRDDGAIAQYKTLEKTLALYSKEMLAAMEQAKRDAEKRNLEALTTEEQAKKDAEKKQLQGF